MSAPAPATTSTTASTVPAVLAPTAVTVMSQQRLTTCCAPCCVFMTMVAVILAIVAVNLDTLTSWTYTIELDVFYVTFHKFEFDTNFGANGFMLSKATYSYSILTDKFDNVTFDDYEMKYSQLCDSDGTNISVMTGSNSTVKLMDTDYACELQFHGEAWLAFSIVTIVVGAFAVIIGMLEQCSFCSKCRDACPSCWDRFGRWSNVLLCFIASIASMLSMELWMEDSPLNDFDHDNPATESGFEYYDEVVVNTVKSSDSSFDDFDYYYSNSVNMLGFSFIFMIIACVLFLCAGCCICCVGAQQHVTTLTTQIVQPTQELQKSGEKGGIPAAVAAVEVNV